MANMFDDLIPQQAAAGGMFDDLVPKQPPKPAAQPDTLLDVLQSLGSGAVRGVAETAMFPVTGVRLIDRLADQGTAWLADKAVDAGRYLTGAGPEDPDQDARVTAAKDASGGAAVRNVVDAGQGAVRGALDAVLHKPQTTAGKYAGTIGEFAAPGGLPSKAARTAPRVAQKVGNYLQDVVGNVIVPAVTSETAGQITEGTAAEPWARLAGALFGNGVTAGGRALNSPEMAVRRATGDMSDADWAAAQALQDNQFGIKLSGPEAISQATAGASPMQDLLRVVEGSIEGRAVTGPFFAQRPAQVDTAVGSVLDRIAPQDAAPSTLGARAATAAEGAIAQTPQGQAVADAIFGAGPRVTAAQAGERIQQPLRDVFTGRDNMRDALADADYGAARASEPRIPVAGLQPEPVRVDQNVMTIRPQERTGTMVPERVEPDLAPAALESRTGAEAIQVDPRPLLRYMDSVTPNARDATLDYLNRVRGAIDTPNGLDTSVRGLGDVRGAIGDMITEARAAGQMQAVEMLQSVRGRLDQALETVPEYAAANRNYQAASRPLEPFQNQAIEKSIRRDEYDRNFTTAPEQVPPTLEQGGPTAARTFNDVAPPDAREAYSGYITTKILDSVTDASGAVNADRLALALRDNADLLQQYPEIGQRLQAVIGADANLAPVRAGPLGRVAGAADTRAAGEAVLPTNPMPGSAAEQGDAVARLAAQDDPTTRSLVRQELGDRYSRAGTETQRGSRENAGTKFHQSVAGNPEREATLKAVLDALPGAPSAEMSELLQVLQATGRRDAVGSRTTFNSSIQSDLGGNNPWVMAFDLARTLGRGALTQAGDMAQRAALRRGLGTLADMFTSPDAVEQLRAANAKGFGINIGETVPRSVAQGATIFGSQ
ncbi:MAG: hypothetical protein ACAH22_00070 [Tardiphaga sp.]